MQNVNADFHLRVTSHELERVAVRDHGWHATLSSPLGVASVDM